MGGLVASVVDHGFTLLLRELEPKQFTGEHLADIWTIAQIQRDFALTHRHLYAVMFAAETVGGYQRSGHDLEQGIETLRFLHRHCRAAVEAGDLTVDEPRTATRQLWISIHGHLMLELAGYMDTEPEPVRSFAQTVATVMIGLGADQTSARDAVDAGRHSM
ncbi:TetR-like C-terminal domain-containing protein [Tsukamurella soli]